VTYGECISSPSDEFDWFYFDLATAHTAAGAGVHGGD
jgi:hypothetical protein